MEKTPKTRKNPTMSRVKSEDAKPISDAIMDAPEIDDGTGIIEESPVFAPQAPMMRQPSVQTQVQSQVQQAPAVITSEKPKIINCLHDEIITIKFLPQDTGFNINEKSSLYGGKADTAIDRYVVPWRRDGSRLVDPLTKEEEAFFEEYLGLGPKALSIYHKPCYWSSSTKNAVNFIILSKDDTRLNLQDPYDYLRYAIARANSEFICPSKKVLAAHHSQTYKYVMISSKEAKDIAHSMAKKKLDCSKLLSNYVYDKDQLITILKNIEGRRMAPNTDADIVLNKIQDYIYNNTEAAYEALSDKYIEVKTIADMGLKKGIITKHNGIFRDNESKTILADEGVSSTYQAMIDYLSSPENSDIKARIESLIKE